MLFFSFGNLAFNCTSGENNIDMLIAAKSRFATLQEFMADNIERIRRVKRAQYDPMCDEFLLETTDEYILFQWSTSA